MKQLFYALPSRIDLIFATLSLFVGISIAFFGLAPNLRPMIERSGINLQYSLDNQRQIVTPQYRIYQPFCEEAPSRSSSMNSTAEPTICTVPTSRTSITVMALLIILSLVLILQLFALRFIVRIIF